MCSVMFYVKQFCDKKTSMLLALRDNYQVNQNFVSSIFFRFFRIFWKYQVEA